MSGEYAVAKGSKLRLKGEKERTHKKKKKKDPTAASSSQEVEKDKEDTAKHGGWWAAAKTEEISGPIAFEFGNQTYVKAKDDGMISIGLPHDENDPPEPEEIFTGIVIGENKIAIKSGYGKYVKVDPSGELVGRSEAIGPPEQFELIFQDERLAILGFNGCFLSVDPDTDSVVAVHKKATAVNFVKLRCQVERNLTNDTRPTEERNEDIRQVEINYVKKFQKFQDKRMRLAEGDREEVKKAKLEGTLHEALLDRRSKMKADRYCK